MPIDPRKWSARILFPLQSKRQSSVIAVESVEDPASEPVTELSKSVVGNSASAQDSRPDSKPTIQHYVAQTIISYYCANYCRNCWHPCVPSGLFWTQSKELWAFLLNSGIFIYCSFFSQWTSKSRLSGTKKLAQRANLWLVHRSITKFTCTLSWSIQGCVFLKPFPSKFSGRLARLEKRDANREDLQHTYENWFHATLLRKVCRQQNPTKSFFVT